MIRSLRFAVLGALAALGTLPSLAAAQIEEGRVPLQTARTELLRLRESYAEMFNAKSFAELGNSYAVDAVEINADGSKTSGRAAIIKQMADAGASAPRITISSDSLTVFGNTAIDIGTTRKVVAGKPAESVRYLAVLRRGYTAWTITHIAFTPVP